MKIENMLYQLFVNLPGRLDSNQLFLSTSSPFYRQLINIFFTKISVTMPF